MARYKSYSYGQTKLILVSFQQQILPGTFEYTLNYFIDHEFDISIFGQPQEHELLEPMIEGTRENFQAIGVNEDIFEETKLTADARFHTEQNMRMLFDEQIDGYVGDNRFRKRDSRFQIAARHKPNRVKIAERFTSNHLSRASPSRTSGP